MPVPLTWVNGTNPSLNDTNLNTVTQLAQDAKDIAVAAAAAAALGLGATAAAVSYSNTTSHLASSNVQAAVDELDGRTDTLEAIAAANATAIANKAALTETPITGNLNGTTTVLGAPTAGTVFNLTLTAATGKLTLPSGFSGAVSLYIRLNQDATGGRDYQIMNGTLLYGGDGAKPVMPTAANAFMDVVATTLDGGTNWFIDKPATTTSTTVRVEDEGGSALAQRSYINFVGAITATDDPTDDRINVVIPFDKRWSPSDNLLKATNMDPAIAGALGTTALPQSAQLTFALKGRIADVMTGVAFDIGVATTGTLTGPFQFVLYASDGNTVLAQTTDCTTAMGGAAGPTTIAFVTPYTMPADSHLYIALKTGTVASGNMPKLSGSSTTGLANLGLNIGTSTSPASTAAPRFGTASATWTGTTPPAALGNITSTGAVVVLMAMY